jgi:hypothetical protein
MLPALVILLVYALHQDVWLWREARPLVLGVLPAGLAYHAAYTLCIPLLMLFLIRRLWPAHLETAAPDAGHAQPPGASGSGGQTSGPGPVVPGAAERAR